MIIIPFIKQTERLKFEPIIEKLYELKIENKDEIVYILFYFCKECIEPKYNKYKNYIGELYLCVNEIKKRLLYNNIKKDINTYINISFEKRIQLNKIIKKLYFYEVKVDGDLNYILYKFCKYNKTIGISDFYNAILSSILKIKDEILNPYENRKIIENGDI